MNKKMMLYVLMMFFLGISTLFIYNVFIAKGDYVGPPTNIESIFKTGSFEVIEYNDKLS